MYKFVKDALDEIWNETDFPLTRRVIGNDEYDYYFVIGKNKTTYTNEDEQEITDDEYDITLYDGDRIVLSDRICGSDERWRNMQEDFVLVLEQDINEKDTIEELSSYICDMENMVKDAISIAKNTSSVRFKDTIEKFKELNSVIQDIKTTNFKS